MKILNVVFSLFGISLGVLLLFCSILVSHWIGEFSKFQTITTITGCIAVVYLVLAIIVRLIAGYIDSRKDKEKM